MYNIFNLRPLSRARLPIFPHTWKPQKCHVIAWTSHLSNFTRMDQEIQKLQVEIHF